MKRKFINGLLLVAMVLAASSSFVSCKDYEDDEHAKLEEAIATKQDRGAYALQTALEQAITTLRAEIAAACQCEIKSADQVNSLINTAINNFKSGELATLLGGKANAADVYTKAEIDALLAGLTNSTVNENGKVLDPATGEPYKDAEGNEIDMSYIINKLNKLATDVAAIPAQIGAVNTRVDSLAKEALTLGEKLKEVTLTANNALALAQRDSVRIDELEATVARIDSLNELYLDSAFAKILADSISLTKAFQEADQLLQDSIDAVAAEVASIKSALYEMVYSVNVNATKNPVLGYLNTSLGLKSTIIAAYYGVSIQDVEFPTIAKSKFVDPTIATNIEESDIAAAETFSLSDGETILGGEGNGGTIYITVNPNTTDISKKKFYLVNSLDEENEAVRLGQFKPSEFLLSTGWTRADNGFYEAPVTIYNPASVAPRIDGTALKAAVKNVIKEKSRASLKDFAKAVYTSAYDNVSNVGTPYAIKTSWEDPEKGVMSTYSDYVVGVYGLTPLSFETASSLTSEVGNVLPVARLESIVNSVLSNVKSFIPNIPTDGLNISDIQISVPSSTLAKFNLSIPFSKTVSIGTVSVPTIPSQTASGSGEVPVIKIWETVTVAGEAYRKFYNTGDYTTYGTVHNPSSGYGYWYDSEVELNASGDGYVVKDGYNQAGTTVWANQIGESSPETVVVNASTGAITIDPITVPDQLIEFTVNVDMAGSIDDLVQSLNGSLSDALSGLNGILDAVGQINKLAATIDDAGDGIINYIQSINDRLVGYVPYVNKSLQPLTLITTANGYARVGAGEAIATKVQGTEATLVATTYTAELLAPAFKKFVAVIDQADGTALTGENLSTVIEGNVREVKVSGLKAGHTYKVVYEALDYAGYVAAHVGYITVVE